MNDPVTSGLASLTSVRGSQTQSFGGSSPRPAKGCLDTVGGVWDVS